MNNPTRTAEVILPPKFFPSALTLLTDKEFEEEKLPENWREFAYWETVQDESALWTMKRLQILDPN